VSTPSERREQILKSRAQETRGMSNLGGQRHAGSGSFDRKADGRTTSSRRGYAPDHALYEFKRTDAKQITIRHRDMKLVQEQAAQTARWGRMGIEVGGEDFVLLTQEDFDNLMSLALEDSSCA
jgi:hypothetical protein